MTGRRRAAVWRQSPCEADRGAAPGSQPDLPATGRLLRREFTSEPAAAWATAPASGDAEALVSAHGNGPRRGLTGRPRDEENLGERTARKRSGPKSPRAGAAQSKTHGVNISRAARCHAPAHCRRVSTLPRRERWTEVVRECSRVDRRFESPASLPVSTWSRTLLRHCQTDRAKRVGSSGNPVEGWNGYRLAWLAIEAWRNREAKPGGCGIAFVASYRR